MKLLGKYIINNDGTIKNKNMKIGTVEPTKNIYNEDTIRFVLGAIKKYHDSPEQHSVLVQYLAKILKLTK